MAATAGVMNNSIAQFAEAVKSKPSADASTTGASDSNNSGTSSSGEATISANDFLTLLVTELQNQDPTANTDPNEYINQLVNVNSLEQLININQTLGTALGSTTASTKSGSATPQATVAADGATASPVALPAAPETAAPSIAPIGSSPTNAHIPSMAGALRTQGNLGIPGVNPAAQRVAHALDGKTRGQPAVNSLGSR